MSRKKAIPLIIAQTKTRYFFLFETENDSTNKQLNVQQHNFNIYI